MKTNLQCPLLKSKCIEQRCAWYIQLRGVNKNTGKEVDDYGCAVAWMPMLLIENTSVQKQSGAAIESLRNESIKGEDATRRVLHHLMGPAMPPLIEDGNGHS